MPPKSFLQTNGSTSLQLIERKHHTWFLPIPNTNLSILHDEYNKIDNFSTWNFEDAFFPPTGLFFASVSQIGCQTIKASPGTALLGETGQLEQAKQKKGYKKGKMKLRIKVGNPHLRRLISGAVAGALSRTAVAPLETVRTHLMVGSNGNSTTEVFQTIMKTEGWQGLFRGNFVNVIRVAPSKAIELFAFDTANKFLTSEKGEPSKLPLPSSLVAGALAGVSSTLCTYPLELIKTRLTIQRDAYENFLHAFIKIVREEGPSELYRGLTPSLIGVIPYAATNYFAYDTLKKLYRKTFKKQEIILLLFLLGQLLELFRVLQLFLLRWHENTCRWVQLEADKFTRTCFMRF